MEQNKNEQKTAQILYITIMLVLVIMALAVGLVTAANRRTAMRAEQTAETTTAATEKTNKFLAVEDIDHTSPSVTTRATEATTEKTTQKAPVTTAATTVATPKEEDKKTQAEPHSGVVPKLIMPTIGDVAKKYSIDALVFSNTMEDYRTHNGIDICAALGEGVMAAADGVVTEVYEHPMMGNTIVIAHEGDSLSVYQNLADEVAVSVGDAVKAGEIIGAVGDSAIIEIAEEPHLHFEVMVGGEYQDPLDYISLETMTVVYDE